MSLSFGKTTTSQRETHARHKFQQSGDLHQPIQRAALNVWPLHSVLSHSSKAPRTCMFPWLHHPSIFQWCQIFQNPHYTNETHRRLLQSPSHCSQWLPAFYQKHPPKFSNKFHPHSSESGTVLFLRSRSGCCTWGVVSGTPVFKWSSSPSVNLWHPQIPYARSLVCRGSEENICEKKELRAVRRTCIFYY